MAYGHAERNLAALRELEAETQQLLAEVDKPDPAQTAWLQRADKGDERGSHGELLSAIG